MRESLLQIRLLGRLELLRDGRPVAQPRSRKTRALLAYLATTDRSQSREHLCDLLWEGPADPRAALRVALSRLRPLVDDSQATRLVSGRDGVALERTGVSVDLITAREAKARAGEVDNECLVRAAGLFRGPFLEGLDLSGCFRFESWCTAEREAARRMHLEILRSLVDRLSDSPDEALGYARQMLQLDPTAESAHLEVIRLLRELGRPREALAQYDACRRILKRELGVLPSREIERIRRAVQPVGKPKPPAVPPSEPALPGTNPPLVGREGVRGELASWIGPTPVAERHAALLLTGEAGIGKSRLLAELGDMTRATGGDAFTGRAFEAEMIRPYSAWIEALRSIDLEVVPAELRLDLAPLFPRLGMEGGDAGDRSRLYEGLVQLIDHLADGGPPLLVALDDLQWIDESSAALAHFITRTGLHGLRLALACRDAEMVENPAALRLVSALREEGLLKQLHLGPLGPGDTARLVQSVDPGVDAGNVYARSEGNPLFALELARVAGDGEERAQSLEDLIASRLARLDSAARWLVPWAAALGHGFDLKTLGAVAELPAADLLVAVEALERHGVIRPQAGRYDFSHDLVREVAYSKISTPRRQLVHSRIAKVLNDRDELGGESAGDVAHHAAIAGDDVLAARACLAAARQAIWAFAPEEAAELAARGIEHLEGLPPETRLGLHVELLGFSIYPGMKEHRAPDLEDDLTRVLTEARAAGLQAEVFRGFQHISYLHYLNGDFSGALDRSLRAQEAGRSADPATVVRAIGDTARCLGILERDPPRAGRLAREANALAKGIGYEGHELPQALGYVHHHAGRDDEAIDCFDRAAHLARVERERWFECTCLARAVMIELERRNHEEALRRCSQLLEVTTNLGEGSDAPFAIALESLARLMGGDEDALATLDHALAHLRDVDSRWMVAYVQNIAGEWELSAGKSDHARERLIEAMEAAEIVERANESAITRSLLIRLELRSGDSRKAECHLSALRTQLPPVQQLSARARASVQAAVEAFS